MTFQQRAEWKNNAAIRCPLFFCSRESLAKRHLNRAAWQVGVRCRRCNVKRLTQLFTTLTTRDRRKGVATDPIAARKNGRKEIRAEKTGLAAGNNFLIDHVAERSAPVANPDPNAYLAINWQPADIEARFTSEDRRFPTPPQPRNNGEIDALVTTNHLLSQHPPRTTGALLPISQLNPNSPGGKYTETIERGAGGQPDAAAESSVSISSHGILSLIGSLPHSCCSQKNALRNRCVIPSRSRPSLSRELAANHQ
jgi:hypothetical protein